VRLAQVSGFGGSPWLWRCAHEVLELCAEVLELWVPTEVVAVAAQVDAMAELWSRWDPNVDGTMNEQEEAVGVSAWVGPQP
jgi:hypothetical protein